MQPFKHSTAEGHCRWCARKLIQQWNPVVCSNCGNQQPWHRSKPGKDSWQEVDCNDWQSSGKTKRYAAAGTYGDGRFCGLRCGYQYAVSVTRPRRENA